MATRSDLCNAIRALAMDAVQQANSGHPGMPMGMAEIAEVVWRHHLRHNPANPAWPNRDRFVVSNGHGSMLLYALLHLSGYDLPMAQLRRFRQLHSKTPGHPEYGLTPGVETTTGPLGQGLANAVGMALAERVLAAQFNRPGFGLIDHRTYVFLGDGGLMEGISHEACSLAGTLGLGKLIAFYDDNSISIDSEKGNIRSWFSDDTPARFRAYGWSVVGPVDGHDSDAIERALQAAQAAPERPTLIVCKTTIAKGAPHKANTGAAHGAPLGADEVAATRANIGWSHPPFEIPADIYADWDARPRGRDLERDWQEQLGRYERQYPAEATELKRRLAGELPADWAQRARAIVEQTIAKGETVATRKASQNVLEALLPGLPELIGGSADLAASNLTMVSTSRPIAHGGGNYIFYGVREFGMCAIANGLALHGGLIPYAGTFLVFSDYARNALRMAALMRIRVVFVFTHDSVGLGEDGPTHQPVEHASALRLIPHMDVWRPCDSTETAVAWNAALERRDGPSSLLLSRQNLAFNARSDESVQAIRCGGYVLADAEDARAVLIATGSEVALALAARARLAAAGIAVRVVSMPSTSVFDRQDAAYRESVLPRGIPRLAIEAGVPDFWRKYVGLEGDVMGIDRFGESAPAAEVFKFFGFTADNVVARTRSLIGGCE
ncbi:MAG: transketolase [Burkholderiales bacterium]|nr:transketolase [Burkholderiales bacterium]